MYFNGKTVSSTPDLAYSLHLEPFAGVTDIQDTILFVIEVKSVGFSDQNSSYFKLHSFKKITQFQSLLSVIKTYM